jgi:intracellular sulfur oxidation DsrE/DsrF family protein
VSLPSRKLTPEGVMSDVKVVGNGWITLVSYQQKGYSYIVP